MRFQDLSALAAAGPGELLERSLNDYVQLFRSVGEAFGSEHLEAVDYALRHTVIRLLVRRAGPEELSEAYDALRRLVPVEREAELESWLPRWRAFADVLDARLASLAAQQPQEALKLRHAGEIVELVVREPGLSQTELGKRMKLKPANLSRILAVLDAHEMIERRSEGREKRVHPGRLASETGCRQAALEPIPGVRRRVGREADYEAPSSAAETILAEIWAEVLGVDQVGVHDDFFALGGDSILSIEILRRAQWAGLSLELRDIFERRTIAALVEVLASGPAVSVE
jgi:aryl carrier-like protein